MTERAAESILVGAAPALVYSIVTDFERYPEWLGELEKIDILARDDAGRAVEMEFRAAAFGRSTTCTLRYDYRSAPDALSWEQTAGDLTAALSGQCRFDATETGTLVTCDLEVDLLLPIPTFVRSRAAARIQNQALGELKARAEGLA